MVNVSLLPASFRSFGTRHEYPQVPSQPKGIGALGDFLAGGVGDGDDRIERERPLVAVFLHLRPTRYLTVSFFVCDLSARPRIMMSQHGIDQDRLHR